MRQGTSDNVRWSSQIGGGARHKAQGDGDMIMAYNKWCSINTWSGTIFFRLLQGSKLGRTCAFCLHLWGTIDRRIHTKNYNTHTKN